MIFKNKHKIHVVSGKQGGVSYHDVLDDLLHQKLVSDHMAPELPVLHEQAQQLSDNGQLFPADPAHLQALQHQPQQPWQEC